LKADSAKENDISFDTSNYNFHTITTTSDDILNQSFTQYDMNL